MPTSTWNFTVSRRHPAIRYAIHRPELCVEHGRTGGVGDAAATDQIQANIAEAHAYYDALVSTEVATGEPMNPRGALIGFFIDRFREKGKWDYKSNYANGTEDQRLARVFGNFNFGAVLESFGLDYTVTQSAAGATQILICGTGGSCGTGVPFISAPFGDQAVDSVDIMKGSIYAYREIHGCR